MHFVRIVFSLFALSSLTSGDYVHPTVVQAIRDTAEYRNYVAARDVFKETRALFSRSKNITLFGGLFRPLVRAGMALHPQAPQAALPNEALIDLPLKIIPHTASVIDSCQSAVPYLEDEPHFEFYDRMFPEDKGCHDMQGFLQLADRFRRERDFFMALLAIIYSIKQDKESLLTRSRDSNMIAIDPEHLDLKDPTWRNFRLPFNEVATKHHGIPQITRHAMSCHDQESVRRYLEILKRIYPKDTFLNTYFKILFAAYL
ncbi:unnamed protein product [Clonostachys byssicola]|uniref:Uncharacterized protein n=1 Tax=Clonostachys byssicola TaxID=160290 RepID=A0A9N9UHU4_9HYPO|nr:unnamed protein product [Clonostachys byssicola]